MKLVRILTATLIFVSLAATSANAVLKQGNDKNSQVNAEDANTANNTAFDNNTDRDLSQLGADFLFGQRLNKKQIKAGEIVTLHGKGGPDSCIADGNLNTLTACIGGTEHFGANNRDRFMGDDGHNVFIWTPGDGSDYINGFGRKNKKGVDPRADMVIFTLIGEDNDNNGEQDAFAVVNDGVPGNVVFDENGLPNINIAASPGACEIFEGDDAKDVNADHVARFFIRAQRDNGAEDGDDGTRVGLTLKNVEVVACTNQTGDGVQFFDLTQSPPAEIQFADLQPRLQDFLERVSVDFAAI